MAETIEHPAMESSVIGSWVIQLATGAEELSPEIFAKDVLSRAGIDPAALEEPNSRIPSKQVSCLYEILAEELPEETVGLALAERLTPGSLHALGYSLFASRTLQAFFLRLQRFFRLISAATIPEVELRNGRLIFVMALLEDIPSIRQDVFVAVVVRFARMAYRSTFSPVLVRFERPPPSPDAASRFEAYFGCPVEFGANRIEVHVAEEDYSQVLRGANPELVRYHDQIATEYLARFDEEKIINRTQDAILKMLPDGSVSVDAVSAALNVSSRSLQRRLQEEGTSFNALLDDMRQYLAVRYLRSGRRSIKEVSYLLGYADPSNFARAFRRLTGKSPNEYLPQSAKK